MGLMGTVMLELALYVVVLSPACVWWVLILCFCCCNVRTESHMATLTGLYNLDQRIQLPEDLTAVA